MKAAIYCRVSTNMQEDRESLTTQQERLTAYVTAQAWTLVFPPFIDAGLSAKDTNRPAFQQLMAACRDGHIDIVVVSKIDRISRSLRDLLSLIDFFKERDIKFVSLAESLDTTSAMGRFMVQLLGAVAELERAQTAERVSTDMRHIAEGGRRMGAASPFGYNLKKGALVVNPDEAQIVREIFDTFLRVNSIRKTAKILNERGRLNKRRAHWQAPGIYHVLSNPVYIGYLQWGKHAMNPLTGKRERAASTNVILIENAHDAILDKAVFEQAQAVLASHDKPVRTGAFYLLRGLVFCGKCGSKMQPRRYPYKEKTYRYYGCSKADHEISACDQKSICIDSLDAAIIQKLTACSHNQDFLIDRQAMLDALKDATKQDRLPDRLGDLNKQEATVNGKISRLLGLFEHGNIDESDFAPLYQQRKADLAAIQQQRADLQRAQAEAGVVLEEMRASLEAVSTFGDGWDILTPEQQRERILTIVEAVLITGEDIQVLLKVDGKGLITRENRNFAEVFDMEMETKHNRKNHFPVIDDFYALNVPFSWRRRNM